MNLTNLPKISIIILNYNAKDFLEKCISSVIQSDYDNFEIIVVDNGSEDKSHIQCKEKFPQIKLIENKKNLGYCEGNNVGLKEANGEYIIILNPDTEVQSDWIKKFLEKFNNHGEGLYQPKLLATNNKKRINSAGNMINVFGFGYSLGKGKNDNKEYNKFKKINYASGACLFTSRKILEKIGYFDSFLFAYHDDLELGWKGAQLNIQSFYVPEIIVYHAESFSFKWSPKKYYLLERNRWYCILTHYSKSTFYKLLPSLIIIEIIICLYFFSKGMFKEKIRASFSILKNYKKIKETHRKIEKEKIISDQQIIQKFSNDIEIPMEVSDSFTSSLFNGIIIFLGKIVKKII